MGEEQDTSPSKLSKEELIQSMDRVDREIAKVEQQIFKLKKKQVGFPVRPFVSEHASITDGFDSIVYEISHFTTCSGICSYLTCLQFKPAII